MVMAQGTGTCVFAADFESPAARRQWSPFGGAARDQNALWSTNASHASRTTLAVIPGGHHHSGGWESPPFSVQAGQYYRVSLYALARSSFYAAVLFSDERGTQIDGDCNWGVEPGDTWTEHTYCFKSKVAAQTGALTVYPDGGSPLWVDDVRVDAVPRSAVLAWANAIYGSMPPLTNAVRADVGVMPAATLAKLKGGQSVKITMFGDSIANDIDNAALDVLLEQAFPGAQVETVFVGRGATAWAKMRHQVRERVRSQQPDLAILLAISNDEKYLGADLKEVLENLRRESPATEVLLVAPHVLSWYGGPPLGVLHREAIRQLAVDYKTGYIDLLNVWQGYLTENNRSVKWLLRDGVHMNERGRQLSARAIVSYLKGAAKSQVGGPQ